VLRAAIATHGNDFRLGANEAPPAIISVFLGEQLTNICQAIEQGVDIEQGTESAMIELGVQALPSLAKDNTDRNRTSPFAFTGNKFEFRALGSNSSISFPLTSLNVAVADGLDQLSRAIEATDGSEESILQCIRTALTDSAAIRFEGNNYADEWVQKAEALGLPHLRNTPQALQVLDTDAARTLFSTYNVLSEAELASRHQVKIEQYITTVEIEVDLLRNLCDQFVLPAALAERTAASADLCGLQDLAERGIQVGDARSRSRLEDLCRRISALYEARERVETAIQSGEALEEVELSKYYGDRVVPALTNLRVACDNLEAVVGDNLWPLPKYTEMLFQN
ncbi:MAG: glutamine synthetase type III, partial [Myxococcota bacterium]|nr:glutamine synthetase type III [Myxococcota bacterium]